MTEEKNDPGYCTLRVPISTRELINKIAKKERFTPNWTVVANRFLLEAVDVAHGSESSGDLDNGFCGVNKPINFIDNVEGDGVEIDESESDGVEIDGIEN